MLGINIWATEGMIGPVLAEDVSSRVHDHIGRVKGVK